jgi:hypothetical protein
MAYDEDLAHRIRALLADEDDVSEQAMFGGLAFLIGGRMAVAVSGSGGLLLRVDPDAAETLGRRAHAGPFVMRGKELAGWLRIAPEGIETKRQLEPWVRRGVQAARALGQPRRRTMRSSSGAPGTGPAPAKPRRA